MRCETDQSVHSSGQHEQRVEVCSEHPMDATRWWKQNHVGILVCICGLCRKNITYVNICGKKHTLADCLLLFLQWKIVLILTNSIIPSGNTEMWNPTAQR